MKILFEEDFENVKTITGISRNLNSLKDVPSDLIPLIHQNNCYKFSLLDGKPGNFLYSPLEGGIFAISFSYKNSSETLGNKIYLVRNKNLPFVFNIYMTESYIRANFQRINHLENMKASSKFCRNMIKKMSTMKTFDEMRGFCFKMYDEVKKKKPLWITEY